MQIYTFEPVLTEDYDNDIYPWKCDIQLAGIILYTHHFNRRYSGPDWRREMKEEALYEFGKQLRDSISNAQL